jgi:hypothetical protein
MVVSVEVLGKEGEVVVKVVEEEREIEEDKLVSL